MRGAGSAPTWSRRRNGISCRKVRVSVSRGTMHDSSRQARATSRSAKGSDGRAAATPRQESRARTSPASRARFRCTLCNERVVLGGEGDLPRQGGSVAVSFPMYLHI